MITNQNISRILRIIKKWSKSQIQPSVSQISRETPSPYRVLISTILSLRTKDQTTAEASRRLFAAANTPWTMVKLSEYQIARLIYPVGFYKTKSRNVLRLSHELIERYGGEVPANIDKLLEFKGVGRKTANLVLILGFNQPAMCVDTHVHRISNRWGYIRTKTPDDSEWALRKKLQQNFWLNYNDLLVTFGQQICKPISPLCSHCPISGDCPKKGIIRNR